MTPLDTILYEYNNSYFPDELTSYDEQEINYDQLGNPLTYLGWNMTWEAGRRLSTMNNGSVDIIYNYDDNGTRTSKTSNGIKTSYTSIDERITSQFDGTNTIYFRYDTYGELTGFNLNGTEYIYEKNAQGDITGILDKNGKHVVYYTYNSWGRVGSITGILAETVGQLNPMRYRGYYFDVETGFYLLHSRYYDPKTGRFINTDEPEILEYAEWNDTKQGINLFSYCFNNPVNYSDFLGYWPGDLFTSSKEAVKNFAYCNYNDSLYIRMEISSTLYMITKNGKDYYSYTTYTVGNPHSCQPLDGISLIPNGGWMIGGIHTHPNSNNFSDADKNWAHKYGMIYVVTPNRCIRVYHDTRSGYKDELVYSQISLSSLATDVKKHLVNGYRTRWNDHISTQCGFGCNNMRWPAW